MFNCGDSNVGRANMVDCDGLLIVQSSDYSDVGHCVGRLQVYFVRQRPQVPIDINGYWDSSQRSR
jgi:hypothetical protein